MKASGLTSATVPRTLRHCAILLWLLASSAFAQTPTNVASQANGGVATASSTYGSQFAPSGANNGDRKGLNWGNGGGWNDATGSFPDWLQVTFNSTRAIGEIDVFTVQDTYWAPAEPTPAMTFSYYGITAFQAQYWDGSAWVDVPGGNVTGNNLVWRKFTFSPISTDRIRVLITSALSSYSRITEVEAWEAPTYEIGGTVTASGSPLAGVAFAPTNGGTCTPSDASGQYGCTVPAAWSGTVTPSLAAYTFTPPSRTYSNVSANEGGQDFAATPSTYHVSGTATANGSPIPGVAVAATNGGTCTPSDASGQYDCTVLAGWSGTVTPLLPGYTFTPASRNFSNVSSNQGGQDFAATGQTSASIFFIHTDHLNTPRVVTNSTGQPVWRWDSDPFGDIPPNEDPTGSGVFTLNLRFPGQYFDKETNLHYNSFRDYDPAIGRYVQSDPIGLAGGLNTYAYVAGNPLSYVDPTGEHAYVLLGLAGIATLAVISGAWKPTFPGRAGLRDPFGQNSLSSSSSSGTRSPSSDAVGSSSSESCPPDPDLCQKWRDEDEAKCDKRYGDLRQRWIHSACYARAFERYRACLTGAPDPGPWSDADVDGWQPPRAPYGRRR